MSFFSHEIMPPDEDLLTMLDTVGEQIGLFMKRKQVEQEKELLAFSRIQPVSKETKPLR
jgi:hypothetical protein